MPSKLKANVQMAVAGLFIFCVLSISLYGCYYINKTFVYPLFYEPMVKQTITEMVKQEYLLGTN